MGEIGSAIKYLYQQLLLRDILSFIMPGAIVLWAIFLVFDKSLLNLNIQWLLYVPLFGLFYLVGFSLQCVGEIIGILNDSPPDEYPFCWKQRRQLLFCKWIEKRDKIWWNGYYKWMSDFWQATKDDEGAQQGRERSVVIKTMSGNGLVAIVLAGVFWAISQCTIDWIKYLLTGILIVIMLWALLWGHRMYVLLQNTREKETIDYWKNNHSDSDV